MQVYTWRIIRMLVSCLIQMYNYCRTDPVNFNTEEAGYGKPIVAIFNITIFIQFKYSFN